MSKSTAVSVGRLIVAKHGQKVAFASEPAQPTRVLIQTGQGKPQILELGSEAEELDFIMGCLPVAWRQVADNEDLTGFNPRHIKWGKVKSGEEAELPTNHIRQRYLKEGSKKTELVFAKKVPSEFIGLDVGDTVITILGGSGEYFLSALHKRLEQLGGQLWQTPAYILHDLKADSENQPDPNQDVLNLAQFFSSDRDKFYEVLTEDSNLIKLRDAVKILFGCMKDRIAAGQRIVKQIRSEAFLSLVDDKQSVSCPKDLILPTDDELALRYQTAKDNDVGFQALLAREKHQEKIVDGILNDLVVYREVFVPIKGCGVRLAMRIISAVGNIRRFPTKGKFFVYAGVHVKDDGTFPRRRSGERNNWNNILRQAFFLFVSDQCNKSPGSHWGKVLRAYKAKLRALHPEVVLVKGKKRYTDGHIHKMAIWRTATKFAQYLYRSWWWLEHKRLGLDPGDRPLPPDPDRLLQDTADIEAQTASSTSSVAA